MKHALLSAVQCMPMRVSAEHIDILIMCSQSCEMKGPMTKGQMCAAWTVSACWLNLGVAVRRYESMLAERQKQRGSATELAAVLSGCSPGRQQPLWTQLSSLHIPLLCSAGSLDAKFMQAGQQMAVATNAESSSRRSSQLSRQLEEALQDRGKVLEAAVFLAVVNAGHAVHIESPEQLVVPLISFQTACKTKHSMLR